MASDKQAFVAMRFDSDPWNDRRYMVIREVLQEAGFDVIRGDEIRTSGNVVEEVCRLLHDASLVVIDTTGDSHNVSYELGFCHGIKRDASATLLVRNANSPAPFNYQHFRQVQYRDLRHLRRLLHSWLDVSTPLTADQTGYTFNFQIHPEHADSCGSHAARAILQVLRTLRFSGRCEYYAHDGITIGLPNVYLVGLGLRLSSRRAKPGYEWWQRFQSRLAKVTDEGENGMKVDDICSEFNRMRAIRYWSIPRGVVQFEQGSPVRILGVGSESLFISEVRGILGSGESQAHSTEKATVEE